jgi:hypothetical protein
MGRLAKEAKIATLTQAQMEVLDQLITRRCQVTEEKALRGCPEDGSLSHREASSVMEP